MKVTIKYFASIREALGQGSEQRDTAALSFASFASVATSRHSRHLLKLGCLTLKP